MEVGGGGASRLPADREGNFTSKSEHCGVELYKQARENTKKTRIDDGSGESKSLGVDILSGNQPGTP